MDINTFNRNNYIGSAPPEPLNGTGIKVISNFFNILEQRFLNYVGREKIFGFAEILDIVN